MSITNGDWEIEGRCGGGKEPKTHTPPPKKGEGTESDRAYRPTALTYRPSLEPGKNESAFVFEIRKRLRIWTMGKFVSADEFEPLAKASTLTYLERRAKRPAQTVFKSRIASVFGQTSANVQTIGHLANPSTLTDLGNRQALADLTGSKYESVFVFGRWGNRSTLADFKSRNVAGFGQTSANVQAIGHLANPSALTDLGNKEPPRGGNPWTAKTQIPRDQSRHLCALL